jgi:nucleoside-diphosphate-sugar epimerase
MKVLLTGGSGNLGQTLVPRLLNRGDTPVILDVRAPPNLKEGAVFIEGSILDRPKLTGIFHGCDCIVHIAAWHGIHETRGEKNAYDFFDLNVRGTFEVFPSASTKLYSFPQPVFIGRRLGTGAARFWPNSLPRIIERIGT